TGIETTYPSLDAICESDIDAAAIFTQNWLHGPQAVQLLEAGKHVYSAVPLGISMQEIEAIVKAVTSSKRIYMLGETSYYYPHVVYCRQKYREGAFGNTVYAEAEYFHDIDQTLEVAKRRGGKNWRKTAGIPPMFYPTHSISQVVSVTGAHMTHVSCQGFIDSVFDTAYNKDINIWANEFSNESALFKMSDGSICRINEFRRVGFQGLGERMSLFGTNASFEQFSGGSVWIEKPGVKSTERLDSLFEPDPAKREGDGEKREGMELLDDDSVFYGTAPIHDTSRLPDSFKGLPNSHHGSHLFLVDDFVVSCTSGVLPPNNIWQAARYMAPGIVAHESALQGGKLLEVPDFGDAPRSLSEM
ncbi:MAG: Gfo/Idh/MocA family oxidoreductase, partial [Paenibacillaceae bacterium]|nr:Gfo/Idh/MocA family oxidoreductase [Paenibacillaceae bacterium]